MSRRVLVALLALALVAPTVATAAGAPAASVATMPENATASSDYSLDDLSQRGERISTDPSERFMGYQGTVFVSYGEWNPIKDLGPPEPDYAVDHVISGETVPANELTFHFNRKRGAEPENVTVVIVTWERETVTRDNETVAVARNVTEHRRQLELSGPSTMASVRLPNSDSRRMVTMYLEEYPEARWVFSHDSVATTTRLPFGGTWGSFLPWFFTNFMLVVGVGVPVAIGAGIKALDEVGFSPGKGMGWYLITCGLSAYFVGYFSLGTIADVVVTLPAALGGVVVIVAFVATLEYADDAQTALFEGITTETVTNPLGEDVPDVVKEAGDEFHFVELDEDELGLVKRGSIRMWLAVVLGAQLPSLDTADLATEYRYGGHDSPDRKFYGAEDSLDLAGAHPGEGDADDWNGKVLRVRWPSIEWGRSTFKKRVEDVERPVLPGGSSDDADDDADEIGNDAPSDGDPRDVGGTVTTTREVWDRDRLSTGVMAFGLVSLVAANLVGTLLAVTLGALAVAIVSTEKVHGEAYFVPAEAHATPAKAQRVTEQQSITVARTFHQLEEMVADLDLDSHERAMEVAEAHIQRTRERLDRLLGGEGPSGINTDRRPDTDPSRNGAGADRERDRRARKQGGGSR